MLMSVDFTLECGTEIIEALVYHILNKNEVFAPAELTPVNSLKNLELLISGDFGPIGFLTNSAYGIVDTSQIVSYSVHVDLKVVASCCSCECTCGDDA